MTYKNYYAKPEELLAKINLQKRDNRKHAAEDFRHYDFILALIKDLYKGRLPLHDRGVFRTLSNI